MAALLEVKNLSIQFPAGKKFVSAVEGVTFSVNAGEILALVGESGSGKTLTALAIMRLLSPPAKIASGEILYNGHKTGGREIRRAGLRPAPTDPPLHAINLLTLPEREMRRVRGREISMIFQEPQTALNPVMKIGNQIAETLIAHMLASKSDARARAIKMLERVQIPSPDIRAENYPHEISGGMKQRVMIASALITEPKLVIADEPTTALDATVQSEILELLATLCREQNTGLILISHDLGVVAEYADALAVMYAGKLVETGPASQVLSSPRHPYTKALLSSRITVEHERGALPVIPGNIPNVADFGAGCRFKPRCSVAQPNCESTPEFTTTPDGRGTACILKP
jgi:oligopeptide/dipeptide ABC transporter ATP-binding protein